MAEIGSMVAAIWAGSPRCFPLGFATFRGVAAGPVPCGAHVVWGDASTVRRAGRLRMAQVCEVCRRGRRWFRDQLAGVDCPLARLRRLRFLRRLLLVALRAF